MNKKQALEIAKDRNFQQPPICNRCGLASELSLFGYAGYEDLCMACFIESMLIVDEDGEFTSGLDKANTIDDLVNLCAYWEG